MSYLKQEKATSKNIKSDSVRHQVESNLERAIQILRQYKSGGFALFSGNGTCYVIYDDLIPWYYRCSKEFITNIIRTDDGDLVGCISMDANDCGFGYINNGVKLLKTIESGIPQKHKKGGQSAKRFNHLRKEAKHEWFKRIAEYARLYFLDNKQVKTLIIHGESFTKSEFINGGYLEYRLQNISKVSDGCYAGHDGLFEANNNLK